jgi:transcription elongation GreA/GreB family factor
MNEEAMRSWMEQFDAKLQRLEESMSVGKLKETPEAKAAREKKQAEEEFIKTMKEINSSFPTSTNPGQGGADEDEFINMLREINS